MRLTKDQHREITTTARTIKAGRLLVLVASAVEATGTSARYADGPAGMHHYVRSIRAAHRPAPRTVRTTHDGRRVVMRRTGRLY